MKKYLLMTICFVIIFTITACSNSVEATDDGSESDTTSNTISDEAASDDSAIASRPDEYTIIDFPVVYQMPELPTGCEITALTMVLNYYGFQADKVEMATVYLPTLASNGTYYGEDGRLYGNDLNQYFIGDPTGYGTICGTGAIVTAANSYLNDNGSTMTAVDRTGATLEELYQMVSEGIPVVVWITIEMQERIPTEGWYTEGGEYVDWATSDHGAVLVGYTLKTVLIADPISGLVEYDSEQFEKVFASRSNQCVVLLQDIDT
ncbi:MAG: C39 family peptidase [Lachnospiraceae bacterium]